MVVSFLFLGRASKTSKRLGEHGGEKPEEWWDGEIMGQIDSKSLRGNGGFKVIFGVGFLERHIFLTRHGWF